MVRLQVSSTLFRQHYNTSALLSSEFCGQQNSSLSITAEDVFSAEAVEYLLEPAPWPEEEKEEEKEEKDNDLASKKSPLSSNRSNLVIFAVDVSGSMATTSEVPALQGNPITTGWMCPASPLSHCT